MKYDFDRIIERRNTDSIKWDYVEEFFGAGEALPMWVADMDFAAPDPVIRAVEKRAAHGVMVIRAGLLPA
jgi:cystathionine beta-lyase